MFPKMIILLTFTVMVVAVTQATVIPCPITSNTTSGLQTACDCTISSCQSGLAQYSYSRSSSKSSSSSSLSNLLGGTVSGLLKQIVALLGPLLASVLTLVVQLLTLVLALVVQLVNLVIQLLSGKISSSQAKSGFNQWYTNGCNQVNSYQGTGVSGVLGLVTELLQSLLGGAGHLLELDLNVLGLITLKLDVL